MTVSKILWQCVLYIIIKVSTYKSNLGLTNCNNNDINHIRNIYLYQIMTVSYTSRYLWTYFQTAIIYCYILITKKQKTTNFVLVFFFYNYRSSKSFSVLDMDVDVFLIAWFHVTIYKNLMYVWIYHYITQNKIMHSYLQTLVVMQQKQCLAIPYLQIHHLAAWYLWCRENPVTRFRVWSGANMQRSGSWRKRFTLLKDRQRSWAGYVNKSIDYKSCLFKSNQQISQKFWILKQR